jgi:hypothetical protein
MASQLAHAALHRRLIQAGASLEIASGVFCVCVPLVLPDYEFFRSILGVPVPLAYQRSLAVVMGAVFLVEGVLLFALTRAGWWFGMALGVVFILDGLVSRPSFTLILLDVLVVFYLYYTREVFGPTGGGSSGTAAG